MYLLDTNVVSELRKAHAGKADANVTAWAASVPAASLFISSMTVHEIELGVLLKERKDAAQGAILRAWLEQRVLPAFAGRILALDGAVAQRAAALHVPNPRPSADMFIAATALVHRFAIMTRNTTDFEGIGLKVVDPWVVVG